VRFRNPQDELLKFLRSPASCPEKPEKVEIRQTHISIVAMTPSLVYKVKKPLDLGFLDFSTLAKRRPPIASQFILSVGDNSIHPGFIRANVHDLKISRAFRE